MDTIFSVLMMASVAMAAGAYFLWRRDGMKKQVWLMLVLAVVMLANVLIWAVPDKDGTAPMDRAAEDVR
jgi:hypothetical protein